MKCIDNERGIALVMALILSLIVLAAVSALLYLAIQGTAMSGYQKRYQTSLEAAKGGVDLITKEIISKTIGQASLSSGLLSSMESGLSTTYSSIGLAFPATTTASCLQNKLLLSTWTNGTNNWANCGSNNQTLDPKVNPDIQLQLSGPTAAQNFNVYAKIVDTTAGNTDTSGLDLQGQGVVESGSGIVAPKQVPYMYRIEVQSERATNPDERSNLSILFAY